MHDNLQQSQNLDVPVMSKLTSLSIHPEGMYLIQDILNEDHLPALTKLVLNIYNARKELNVASQLNLWKRHRGVKFLSLSLDSRSSLDVNTIGEQIVRLFPSVRKFELILWLDRTNSIQEVNQMMAPYQNWALEEANVRGYRVKAASVLVAILENMANWKGADYIVDFLLKTLATPTCKKNTAVISCGRFCFATNFDDKLFKVFIMYFRR